MPSCNPLPDALGYAYAAKFQECADRPRLPGNHPLCRVPETRRKVPVAVRHCLFVCELSGAKFSVLPQYLRIWWLPFGSSRT